MASTLFKQNIDTTSNGYKVVLSYLLDDSTTRYAEIDVQDGGLDVKSNVELTSFPTLQGHNISDHIYRQPIEVSIKGMFADNGLKAYGWVGEDRLTKIQSEFEACQRAGVKFNIITMRNTNANDRSNWRFLARHNMVLTSISWTQMQHSLSFMFNFKEAISSNLQIVDVVKDSTDPHLPAITDLSAASLVGEIISTNDVITMTIEILSQAELLNDATIQRSVVFAVTASITARAVIGLTVGGMVILSLLASAGVIGQIPVAGWVIAAAIVVVAAVAAAIIGIVEAINVYKRAEKLAYYRKLGHVFLITDNMSDTEKDKIVLDFINFLGEVKTNVDNALSDIAVFRIAKADRQECTLNVDGSYYVQRIEKNDDDLSYRISSFYLGQTQNASLPKITALESFADATDNESAIYFRNNRAALPSTYRVYIISRSAYKQELLSEETNEDKLQNYMQTDEQKYLAEKENLLDFAFVVSPYELSTLTDRIAKVIKKTMG